VGNLDKIQEALRSLADVCCTFEYFVEMVNEKYPEWEMSEEELAEEWEKANLDNPCAENLFITTPGVRSRIMFDYWKHPEEYIPVEKVCKWCDEIFIDKVGIHDYCSRECARSSSKQTVPEEIYELYLKEKGLEYKKHFRIDLPSTWTYVDFFIEPNVCIYIDGDYWHGSDFPDVVEKDRRQDEELESLGHKVLRLSESKVYERFRGKDEHE